MIFWKDNRIKNLQLHHSSLQQQIPCFKPLKAQALPGQGGGQAQDDFCHALAGKGGQHKAVAGVACGQVKARGAGDLAVYGVSVRGHVVQAGPLAQHAQFGQGRGYFCDGLGHGGGEAAVGGDAQVAGLLFAGAAHDEGAVGGLLAVEVEGKAHEHGV